MIPINLLLHRISRITQCAICSKRFASVAALQIHMNFAHKEIDDTESIGDLLNVPDFVYEDDTLHDETLYEEQQGPEGSESVVLVEVKRPPASTNSKVQCKECGIWMKKISMYRHVRRIHQKLRKFACDLCGKKFFKKHEVVDHISKCHNAEKDTKISCEICGRIFMSKKYLNRHIKTDHCKESGGKLVCVDCGKEFKSKTMLNRHLKLHVKFDSSGNPFETGRSPEEEVDPRKMLTPCPECGKVITKQSMFCHITLVHRKRTTGICDYCGREFGRRNHLIRHINSHIPKEFREKLVKCEECGIDFYTKDHLKNHTRKYHSKKNENQTFECECGKVFKHISYLNTHKNCVHERKYERTCGVCGKILANRSDLSKHMRIFHTEGGRGNFMCTDCGKRFDEVGRLNHHRKIHSEPKFVCDEPGCSKKFYTKSGKSEHMNSVHLQQRNFICSVKDCGKPFTTKQRLERHTKVTHEQLKAKCPVDGCSFMVGRRDYMKNHLKRHSDLEPEELAAYLEEVKKMKLI
jgi:KRAB domain-containing zinc finger protein